MGPDQDPRHAKRGATCPLIWPLACAKSSHKKKCEAWPQRARPFELVHNPINDRPSTCIIAHAIRLHGDTFLPLDGMEVENMPIQKRPQLLVHAVALPTREPVHHADSVGARQERLPVVAVDSRIKAVADRRPSIAWDVAIDERWHAHLAGEGEGEREVEPQRQLIEREGGPARGA
eukprot:6437382-Prymnesium_polylepis.1